MLTSTFLAILRNFATKSKLLIVSFSELSFAFFFFLIAVKSALKISEKKKKSGKMSCYSVLYNNTRRILVQILSNRERAKETSHYFVAFQNDKIVREVYAEGTGSVDQSKWATSRPNSLE